MNFNLPCKKSKPDKKSYHKLKQSCMKKQHKQVMQLHREKEELTCSYNIEKEQVSKIVQLLVSDKEEMQVRSLRLICVDRRYSKTILYQIITESYIHITADNSSLK